MAELHLLRLRGRRDPDRWRRTEALRDLLDGRSDVAGRAELGLDDSDPGRILAIAPLDPAGSAATVPARIVDVVSLFCDSWDPRALCVTIDDTVYALLPEAAGDRPERARRLAVDIVATARRSADLGVLVAIGPVVTGVGAAAGLAAGGRPGAAVPASGTAGPAAVATGRAPGDRDAAAAFVGSADDLPQAVALLAIADHLPPTEDLMLPAVAALLRADETGGTPYAETVLTYLGTMGDIARTATAMNVHENTVRYRIRRAEEVYGLDLADPDRVLVTWLQLRLAKVAPRQLK